MLKTAESISFLTACDATSSANIIYRFHGIQQLLDSGAQTFWRGIVNSVRGFLKRGQKHFGWQGSSIPKAS